MFRSIPLFVLSLFLISTLGLFYIKHHVKELKKEIIATKQQLVDEKERLHVLEAEWAYLNDPKRLQQLVDHYLVAQTMDTRQIQIQALNRTVLTGETTTEHAIVEPVLRPTLSRFEVRQ